MAPSKGNNLKLSSHSLRRLMVHSVCNLEDIELSTPNLDLFVYSCSLLDLSMVRNIAHLKASMRCYPHDSIDILWFHKLRLFLGKKSGFRALNLYIRTSQKFTELGRLKAIELPPYKLEHVELQLDTCSQIAFVDAVLWCFRPRILTLISSSRLTYFEGKSELLMFTYKKLLHQEDQGHTNIKIVSPSLLTTLPHEGKAISFIKEEVLQEAEHTIKSSRV
ncbi:uncharacterized protein LOC143535616 [Bidens hawaiensis]|uniref:uncharacterized protein LOC143535616 n=1 Tax=Bidens hawaiensis TaxID=980011 RepID=UPI00404B9F9C